MNVLPKPKTRWTSKPLATDKVVSFQQVTVLLDHLNRDAHGVHRGFQSRTFTRFTRTPCTEEKGVSCFRSDNNDRDLIAYGVKVAGTVERKWRLTGWGSALWASLCKDEGSL